jgi:hypothetical protein
MPPNQITSKKQVGRNVRVQLGKLFLLDGEGASEAVIGVYIY